MDQKIRADKVLDILSLEDSPRDFEIIRELLIDAGYDLHMDRVETEKDFTSALRSRKYDIILADFKLPGFDAFAALRLSIDICPDVPLICVSGSIGEETAIELIKLGAIDYVLKDRLGRLPFAVKRALDDANGKAARKRAEEALLKSEAKYRSIFENAVEGIFQTTPEGRYISVNPALVRMIGYDSPEGLMEGITDLSKRGYVNPEDRVTYKKIIEDEGVIQGFEIQHYKKDGSIFWVSINARAIQDTPGKEFYYEGTIEDITSRKQAEEDLKAITEKLRKSLVGTIHALSVTVETRDPYTAGHQQKVSSLARVIAQEMGLPNDTVDTIRMAGTIHDIGKVAVPAEILSKPTKLTDIEFKLIKVHPQAGYDILKDVGLPYPIAEIVYQHHERLDGSGYPQGLKDGQILLEACILTVADVVEAMASHRPYRPARGIDAALEEIEKNEGIFYDAKAVDACVRLFREKGFTFTS